MSYDIPISYLVRELHFVLNTYFWKLEKRISDFIMREI